MNKKYFSVIAMTIIFLLSHAVSAQVTVTINVIPPPSTDSKSVIYIVGDNDVLGNWDPGAIPMKKVNDKLWTFTGEFPEKKVLQFKLTRGSWRSQAMFEPGVLPDNILKVARPDAVYTIEPLFWSDEYFKPKGTIVGTIKYHDGLIGLKLNHARDLIVWLPPSYDSEPNKRYPVVYMNDGQNIIDPKTATKGMEWRADEIADSLIKANKLEEIIIVGIYHTPDREFEYLEGDLGKAYADFVAKTVKPLIDKTYRTKPERENTAIIGSAMGGLSALWIGWKYPQLFKNVGALSGTFNLESDKILKEIKGYKGPTKDLKLYLDMGGKDIDVQSKRSYDEIIGDLSKIGYAEGRNLKSFYYPTAEHNENAWSLRLPQTLQFFFGK